MNLKFFFSLNLLIIILMLSYRCKRDEFSWGEKIGDISFSGNVVFLGSKDLELLKEVTESKLVFIDKTSQIEKITDMSVLVIGVSAKTPYGSLRKVNSIQQNGTEITILTSAATLTDAIKEGTIQLHQKLIEKDFKLISKTDGVSVKGPAKYFDGLAVTLTDFEIYNDGTKLATLDGSVGISPEIDLTIKIKSNKINEINLTTTLNKIDEVTFVSNAAFNGEKEIVAAEFLHSPIIIDSLVFIPDIIISCGFNGTLSGEAVFGVRQDRVITSGMNYQNSDWSEGSLTQSMNFDYMLPQTSDNMNLKIFMGPEIKILLFGVPVQIVKADGFQTLEAQKTSSLFWRLFIGNDGYNAIKSDILGISEDHSLSIQIAPYEIGNSNNK